MELTATYNFEADPEKVYDLLTDTALVADCLPGCEKLEKIGENRYKAALSMGLAAVTGRYEGTVELKDLNRPSSYALVIDGKGRQGFVKGQATVELTPENGGTRVDVKAEANIAGAIARVGQRLISGAAKVMTDRFFNCMRERAKA